MSSSIEMGFLNSLLSSKQLTHAIRKVDPACLEVPELREIYSFVVDYFKKYKTCPSIEVIKEKYPTYEHKVEVNEVDYYIDRVLEKKLEENLTEFFMEGAQVLKEQGGFKAIDYVRSRAIEISSQSQEEACIDISQDTDKRFDNYTQKSAMAIKGLMGVPCGLPHIDGLTSGFNNGDLITVCGLTGVGKSFLATFFAKEAWVSGHKVLFINLEITTAQLEQRFDALMGKFNHFGLKSGTLNALEMARYKEYLDGLKDGKRPPFLVWSGGDCTQSTIFSLIQEHKPDICFIDYIDLVRDEKRGKEHWETANIIKDLKTYAKDLNIPIVIIAQISRTFDRAVTDIPSLEHIASSIRIPRFSDIVLALHQTSQQKTDKEMMLGMTKNRDGIGCQRLDLRWDINVGRIEEKVVSSEPPATI